MTYSIPWKTVPFLRLLLPLLSGLLLEYYIPLRIAFPLIFLSLSLVILIFCNCIPFQVKFRAQCIYGIAVQSSLISLGSIIMCLHQDKPLIDSGVYVNGGKKYLLIQVLNDPVQKKTTFKCLANLEYLVKNQTCFCQNEKVLIYLRDDRLSHQVKANSWIFTNKNLQPIENFKSLDFDYKKFCRLRHIYSQLYLKENEYSVIPNTETRSALSVLVSLRKKILIIIKKYVPSKSENSLLEALMVGYTDDLDPLLLKSYADSGVVHIIAISGLHLALICQFLQIILVRKNQTKYGRWINLFVMNSCLWGYSLLSGASPSVIRAAGMFSLVLFARTIFRETTLFNILAASAFLIICYDPYWIFDTGFQLSYAAVLSLGIFSKTIREFLPLQNKFLRALWNATSVSIAAQILTTPISIYYFHRFPTYFLVANLVAVPLSSLILACGIFLCVCNTIQPLAEFIGWMLGILIRVLNGFIDYISAQPGAVVANLRISLSGLIILYVSIFCSWHFLKSRNKSWLFTGMAMLAAFLFIRMVE